MQPATPPKWFLRHVIMKSAVAKDLREAANPRKLRRHRPRPFASLRAALFDLVSMSN